MILLLVWIMIELLYLFMPITFDHSYFVLLVRCYLLKYDSSTCLNYDQTVLLVFYAYHVLCLSRLIIVILFYSYVYAYHVRCYLLKYDSSTCLNYDRAALLVYAYHVRCYLLKYDSSTFLNYDRASLLVYAYHVLVFLFFFFPHIFLYILHDLCPRGDYYGKLRYILLRTCFNRTF